MLKSGGGSSPVGNYKVVVEYGFVHLGGLVPRHDSGSYRGGVQREDGFPPWL